MSRTFWTGLLLSSLISFAPAQQRGSTVPESAPPPPPAPEPIETLPIEESVEQGDTGAALRRLVDSLRTHELDAGEAAKVRSQLRRLQRLLGEREFPNGRLPGGQAERRAAAGRPELAPKDNQRRRVVASLPAEMDALERAQRHLNEARATLERAVAREPQLFEDARLNEALQAERRAVTLRGSLDLDRSRAVEQRSRLETLRGSLSAERRGLLERAQGLRRESQRARGQAVEARRFFERQQEHDRTTDGQRGLESQRRGARIPRRGQGSGRPAGIRFPAAGASEPEAETPVPPTAPTAPEGLVPHAPGSANPFAKAPSAPLVRHPARVRVQAPAPPSQGRLRVAVSPPREPFQGESAFDADSQSSEAELLEMVQDLRQQMKELRTMLRDVKARGEEVRRERRASSGR